MPHRFAEYRRVLLLLAMCGAVPAVATAQQTYSPNGRHYVYDQFVPPGVAGQMSVMAGNVRPFTPQQVRIRLPADGTITFYDGSPDRPMTVAAPAQVGMMVGPMYRLKIAGLADHPHTEFFPSIELIDELHPPPGQAERFPIEIEFLPDELAWAADGRMVTKVVYLEQPDRVPLRNLTDAARVTDVQQGQNAVAEADLLGRPIAIIRLGGRTPDPRLPDPQFWGPLAPVQLTQVAASAEPQARRFPQEPDRNPQPRIQRPQISVFPAAMPAPGTTVR